jgi:hypothetical protein
MKDGRLERSVDIVLKIQWKGFTISKSTGSCRAENFASEMNGANG